MASSRRLLAPGRQEIAGLLREGSEGPRRSDVKVFKDHNVEVVHPVAGRVPTPRIAVARKARTPSFGSEVPDGKKLIDEALNAK